MQITYYSTTTLDGWAKIQKEITAFLQQLKSQKATQFANFLQDKHKMDVVAFWWTSQDTLMSSI